MEDMAKLGDLALKLERYRANIIHALSWVVSEIAFSGLITLANALVLLGYHRSVFFDFPCDSRNCWRIHLRYLLQVPTQSQQEMENWNPSAFHTFHRCIRCSSNVYHRELFLLQRNLVSISRIRIAALWHIRRKR